MYNLINIFYEDSRNHFNDFPEQEFVYGKKSSQILVFVELFIHIYGKCSGNSNILICQKNRPKLFCFLSILH